MSIDAELESSTFDGPEGIVDVRTLAGVDSCSGGWVVVSLNETQLTATVESTFEAVVASLPGTSLSAIAISRCLRKEGPRQCEFLARLFLGSPRSSSIFSPPIRPMLNATTYVSACEIGRATGNRRISKQSYGLMDKI